jgi:Flp pilus assembly protein TadB
VVSLISVELLMAVGAGALAGAGGALLILALAGRPADAGRRPSLLRSPQQMIEAVGKKLPIGVGVGLAVLVVTRWPVAAIAAGLFAASWTSFFGGNAAERLALARIEGLATWTESLRDTIAGAVGLEQAIPATAYAAHPAIKPQLRMLVDRLRVRTPLPTALHQFADEFDDPSADLIIATLILNSRLRGPGLRDVLTSLAESAREELDMRRRINAGRRSTRRSVQIVVLVTVVFAAGLVLLNPSYVEPYDSFVGQLVLALVIGIFGVSFAWLRRLSRFEMPDRFLRSAAQPPAPAQPARAEP